MKNKKIFIVSICIIVYMIFIISKYEPVHKSYVEEEKSTQEIVGQDETKQKELTIVTSFYPMYMHVKELTKGVPIKVVNMASSQVGCLHDYQLRVEDMKTLQKGNILVINGLGAESFIEKAYEQNPNIKVINASESLEKALGYDKEHEHNHKEKELHGEHEHDEVAHEEADEHEVLHHKEDIAFEDEHSGHNHANEHIWVSLSGSLEQIKTISEALQDLDPMHEELYQENEIRYSNEILALKKEANKELEGLKDKKIVLVHNAFEYFVEELGLEIVATISSEEQAPTPKEIEEIVKLMKEEEIKAIFTETQYKDLGIVRTIGKESESTIYELDSLVTSEKGIEDGEIEYIQRMKNNIKLLKEAYGL